jgi:hypothetical protein
MATIYENALYSLQSKHKQKEVIHMDSTSAPGQPTNIEDSAPNTATVSNAIQPSHDGDQPHEANQLVPSPHTPFYKRKRLMIVLIALTLLILIVIGGVYYKFARKESVLPSSVEKTSLPKAQQNPLEHVSGATILETARPLGNLHFFKDTSFFGGDCVNPPSCTQTKPFFNDSDLTYYQIGETKDKQPIVVMSTPTNGELTTQIVAIQTSGNAYTLLPAHNTYGTYVDDTYAKSLKQAVNDTVSVDASRVINELVFPSKETYKGLTLSTFSGEDDRVATFLPSGLLGIRGPFFPNLSQAPSKLGTLEDGKDIYLIVTKDSTNFQVKQFFVTLHGVMSYMYRVDDPFTKFISDNKPLNFTWNNGQPNDSIYFSAGAGCGSAGGFVTAKNVTKNSLTDAGRGPNGEVLYSLPDSSALLNELYSTDYNSGSELDNHSLQNLSLADFQKKHAVFVAANPLGEYIVYQRSDMFLRGGCGKPVVYLYPTHTTLVNVQVGAWVNKSVPLYPQATGWRNVLAQPSGQLRYNGKAYNSLYWEGTGFGVYPSITSGTIVKSADAPTTIRHQLAAQGLKANEINDFMAFWQPRLPHTPYVRLSWLDTTAMNSLAPLQISPRADTTIRVFLDFTGLQKPVPLSPQHFTAPARNGFTVVEWGGLLQK